MIWYSMGQSHVRKKKKKKNVKIHVVFKYLIELDDGKILTGKPKQIWW